MLRVADWQHFEQQRVQRAENRRIRADAESQRENGDSGTAGTPAQLPQGIAKIAEHSCHFSSYS
jgi:hypothetical protein